MLSPTRRTFLALGAFGGAQLVCGCSSGGHDGTGPHPDPDLPLRTRAVAATDSLLALYDAVLTGPDAAQADTLKPLRADLVAHRAALATGLPSPSPSRSASPSHSPSPSPARTSAAATATASPSAAATTAPATVAGLAAAEQQTATARLADLNAASPALAKLLAAVSASDAVHAAILGNTDPITASQPAPAPSPTGSPSATRSAPPLPGPAATGLQTALAAEHAAVYGWGVAGAHLPTNPQHDDGYGAYTAHQARRDAWQRLLITGGATPAPAAPGYQLPFAVTTPATAVQLAVHIEMQLTAVYANLVAATTGPLRASAAEALRQSALRARHWGAELPALPGLANSNGGTASASPSA